VSDRFPHAFWHATLEYFGVAGRTLRPPQHTSTDEEMKQIKTFFDQLGLYPERQRKQPTSAALLK